MSTDFCAISKMVGNLGHSRLLISCQVSMLLLECWHLALQHGIGHYACELHLKTQKFRKLHGPKLISNDQ